jgi:hypothetical protein
VQPSAEALSFTLLISEISLAENKGNVMHSTQKDSSKFHALNIVLQDVI